MGKLTESLFKWLQTFDGIKPFKTIEELADGYIISQVLSSISPDYFNQEWLSKIKSDVSSENWRLRISNLKKIQDRIVDYYNDILSIAVTTSLPLPDINAIGKEYNSDELGRLLQLVIGCAVNCDKKQEYIEAIMRLEEEVQLSVMEAIQEIMMNSKERDASVSLAFPDSLNADQVQVLKEQLRKVSEELHISNDARDLSDQKIFELENALKLLKDEKASLINENERLNQRLNDKTGSSPRVDLNEPSDASLKDRHYNKLQSRIVLLQEDLYKMEAHKEEYRAKNEILEKELMELRLKNEDLQRKAKDARALKDELDIMRHVSDKVEKYEQLIEIYKTKLEEMLDLKRQIKMCEEKNTQLMKTNLELEEELKKSATLKAQLDLYKKQIQDLHSDVAQHSHRADKAEFDCKRALEKCETLSQANSKLSLEVGRLKAEMQETKINIDSDSLLDPIAKDAKCLINEINREKEGDGHDIRERIIKLEHENKMLAQKLRETDNEKVILLQTHLGVAKERISEIENENRLSNRTIIELKSKLDELKVLNNVGSKINETEKVNTNQEMVSGELHEAQQRIIELETILSKKDQEMNEMEVKYKKYVSKAKQAVRALEPLSLQTVQSNSGLNSNGPKSTFSPNAYGEEEMASFLYTDDINAVKEGIIQKNKQILELEAELDKVRSLKEMEQKLMTVAFHNLAANVQRRSAAQRLVSRTSSQTSHQFGSFLTRQRQASNKSFNSSSVQQRRDHHLVSTKKVGSCEVSMESKAY